ncbi:MAG: pseudouridine synthase [Hyphomicrobiaceae bacterium]|nr:pseudouridine synthase [Hyphomicrobiaceae bacterium]
MKPIELPPIELPKGPPPAFIYTPPREPFLDIIHRDDEVLLLNKPSGLLSVPGKSEAHKDCLELRAKSRFPSAKPVHRLDMDTSGLLLMGLREAAHRYLSIGFERRLVQKTYIALVYGHVGDDEGLVDQPLICDWPNRPRQMICPERGKASQTKWQVRGFEGEHTRLELTPLTGRSHQLRVHMASIGHPILGDKIYAHDKAKVAAPRLCLHAETLSFRHPKEGGRVEFAAPCPF